MIRIAIAGLALLAFAGTAAAEEDNSAMLVDLFAKICASKPARPSQLEHIATALGFASESGPITPDMERGPKIDIVYGAKLVRGNERLGSVSAYFTGPDDALEVSCAVTLVGVSADALPGLIEKSLKARERADQPTSNENHRQVNWRVGAGSGDKLDMSVWRTSPRRASINLNYVAYKR
jgi:hypothetical protein